MAEVFDPPDLSISDRPKLKEVDDYRNTALAPPPALPSEKENAPVRCVNDFERLLDKVNATFRGIAHEGTSLPFAAELSSIS